MAKQENYLDSLLQPDKKMRFAIILAAFGIILFVALALTIPWV